MDKKTMKMVVREARREEIAGLKKGVSHIQRTDAIT
jgi:hypothetical protein